MVLNKKVMTHEAIIHRYNRLNGNAITRGKLKEFHTLLQTTLDSNGHGPLAKDVRGIHTRITELLKKEFDGIKRVEVKAIEIKEIEKVESVKPKKVKSKKLKVLLDRADEAMLSGLECIQDDKELQGKELGAIGDTTYKVITDKILSLIEKGGLIWRKPWNANHQGSSSLAHNYITKNYYRGGNYYLNYLLLSDYQSPYFFTFRQVEEKGGKVKAGSKGWPVIYFKWLYKKIGGGLVDEKEAMVGNKVKPGYERFPALFYYTVFNFEQTEGLTVKPFKAVKLTAKQKIDSCERIVKHMQQKPPITHVKGDRAFYRPSTDSITMPLYEQFKIDQEYYSTLFHEMVHSTGSPKRLDRNLTGRFGTKPYAFEELIAELGASYLCGESGIFYFTMNNTAAYIKSWTGKLKQEMEADPKFFLKASAAAEKASEFILTKDKVSKPKKVVKEKTRKPVAKKELKKRVEKVSKPVAEDKSPVQVSKPTHPQEATEAVSGIETFKKKSMSKKPKPMHGIVDASTLAGVKFRTFDLTDRYKREFHKLNSDTQLMIWGKPGHGKSVWALEFAQYLAEQLGLNTLYVANEEFGRSTFADKLKQFNIGHPKLKFAKTLTESMVSHFDAILFDSINSIGMTLKEYRSFVDRNPGKLYVLIVQTTKEGDFRGGKDWEHEVDTAGEISNRKLILHKNRFDKNNPEKMEKLLTDDAINEAKKRAEIRNAVKAAQVKVEPTNNPIAA